MLKLQKSAITILIVLAVLLSHQNCNADKPERPQDILQAPASSTAVAILPWCFDADFNKSQTLNGTDVLLAGFCTVLKDPLPGEEYNVHLAASMLAGIVIPPGGVFSQNSSIGPYTIKRGFREGPTYSGTNLIKTIGGGVCKIASTLYNVAILSNLEVVERYCHSMPVPYVPYGQDATVSYGNKDFRFRNNTSDPVMIWAEGMDNRLYIAFYGCSTPPVVKWEHNVVKTIKAPVINKINPLLGHGEKKIILEGMDGAVVKSRVHISINEETDSVKELGISSYSPFPFIEEIGP